ncbi:MAG: hypothetical protein AVDCRST_MAG88-3827, partial [uncultured Thermomicrobiales bacterium]
DTPHLRHLRHSVRRRSGAASRLPDLPRRAAVSRSERPAMDHAGTAAGGLPQRHQAGRAGPHRHRYPPQL